MEPKEILYTTVGMGLITTDFNATLNPFYGPWKQSEFDTENYIIDSICGDNLDETDIPLGLTIAVESDDPTIILREYWWLGTEYKWQLKGSGSGSSGTPGTSTTVTLQYVLNMTNNTVSIPTNSEGKCHKDALKSVSTTQIRISTRANELELNPDIALFKITGLPDNLIYEQVVKSDESNKYIEFNYQFKEDCLDDDGYGVLTEDFSAIISFQYGGGYSAFNIQRVTINKAGYSYHLTTYPDYMSIDKNGQLSKIVGDIDKIDHSNQEQLTDYNSADGFKFEVKYYDKEGNSYNVTGVQLNDSGLFEINEDCTIEGLQINDQSLSLTLKNAYLSGKYLLYGEFFLIKVYDNNGCSDSEYINIIRQSDLIVNISYPYVFNLSNTGSISFSQAFLNQQHDIIKEKTKNYATVGYNGEVFPAKITELTVTGLIESQYNLVKIDNRGNEYNSSDTDSFWNGFYFTKLGGDCAITVKMSSELDMQENGESIRKTVYGTETLNVLFVKDGQDAEGYFMSIYPDSVLCDSHTGFPLNDTQLLFSVYKYDGTSITPLENVSDLGNAKIVIQEDGTTIIDKNSSSFMYNIPNENLGGKTISYVLQETKNDKIINHETETVKFYNLPKDGISPSLFTISNNNIIIDDDIDKTTENKFNNNYSTDLFFASQTAFKYNINGIDYDIYDDFTYDGYKYIIEGVVPSSPFKIVFYTVDKTYRLAYKSKEECKNYFSADYDDLIYGYYYATYNLYKYPVGGSVDDKELVSSASQTIKIQDISDGEVYYLQVTPENIYKYSDGTLTDDIDEYQINLYKRQSGKTQNISLNNSNEYIELYFDNNKITSTKQNQQQFDDDSWKITILNYLNSDALPNYIYLRAYDGKGQLVDQEQIEWSIITKSLYVLQIDNDSININKKNITDDALKELTETNVSLFYGNEEKTIDLSKLTCTLSTNLSALLITKKDEQTGSIQCYARDLTRLHQSESIAGYITYQYIAPDGNALKKRQTISLNQVDGKSYKLLVQPNNIQLNGNVYDPNNVSIQLYEIGDQSIPLDLSDYYFTRTNYAKTSSTSKIDDLTGTADSFNIGTYSSQLKCIQVDAYKKVEKECKSYTFNVNSNIQDNIFIQENESSTLYQANIVQSFSVNNKQLKCFIQKNYMNAKDHYYGFIVPNKTANYYYPVFVKCTTNQNEHVPFPRYTDPGYDFYSKLKQDFNQLYLDGGWLYLNGDKTSYEVYKLQSPAQAQPYQFIKGADAQKTVNSEPYYDYELLDSETIGISKQGAAGISAAQGYSVELQNDNVLIDDDFNNDTLKNVSKFELIVKNNGAILSKDSYSVSYSFSGNTGNILEIATDNNESNYVGWLKRKQDSGKWSKISGAITFDITINSTSTKLTTVQKFMVLDYSDGCGYNLAVEPNGISAKSNGNIADTEFTIHPNKFKGDELVNITDETLSYIIYYKSGGNSEEQTIAIRSNTEIKTTLNNLNNASKIVFYLKSSNGFILDSETVSVAEQGEQGLTGGILRFRGEWNANTYYCCQSDYSEFSNQYTNNNRFIDIVEYTSENKTNYYQAKAGDATNPNHAKQPNATNSSYWTQASKYECIITENMLADSITTKIMNSQKILITDQNNKYTGGMVSDPSLYKDNVLWIGGNSSDGDNQYGTENASFKVDKSGKLTAKNADIEGDITANSLTAKNDQLSIKLEDGKFSFYGDGQELAYFKYENGSMQLYFYRPNSKDWAHIDFDKLIQDTNQTKSRLGYFIINDNDTIANLPKNSGSLYIDKGTVYKQNVGSADYTLYNGYAYSLSSVYRISLPNESSPTNTYGSIYTYVDNTDLINGESYYTGSLYIGNLGWIVPVNSIQALTIYKYQQGKIVSTKYLVHAIDYRNRNRIFNKLEQKEYNNKHYNILTLNGIANNIIVQHLFGTNQCTTPIFSYNNIL